MNLSDPCKYFVCLLFLKRWSQCSCVRMQITVVAGHCFSLSHCTTKKLTADLYLPSSQSNILILSRTVCVSLLENTTVMYYQYTNTVPMMRREHGSSRTQGLSSPHYIIRWRIIIIIIIIITIIILIQETMKLGNWGKQLYLALHTYFGKS